MKTKFLYAIKCLCFFAILGLLIIFAYRALKWKDTTGEYLSSVEQLYATPENLIDVVFVGSSHCYCGIHPYVLWRNYGIAAFDLAVSGQDKDSAYHDLVELYKTQSPSVIYVDLYALLFDRHDVEANVYRNYLSLRISSNSVALVNKYIEEEDREAYYLRFPIIHTRYRELKKYDFLNYAPNLFGRGEYFEWDKNGSWSDPDALNDRTIVELSEKNRKWLEDVIALAEEHGSKIEFIVIPFAETRENQLILNAAEEMLSAGNYSFTNYNKMLNEVGIDLQNDFADVFHLNVYGAEKLTSYIGMELTEKYDLLDHRGDDRYWQWDEDLRWYENSRVGQILTTTDNPYEYISELTRFSDGVTVVSLDGDFLYTETDYFKILEPLGMKYEEYLSGGKWIYRDGKLTKIQENVIGTPEVICDLNKYDSIRLWYGGTFHPENIMLGKDAYQGDCALTCVTYDSFLEKVTAVRGF